MVHEWWWFNRYESVNYPVHHNRLCSQTAFLLSSHNPVMESTTRGDSSSLGPGILQKGNPGSQILTPLTLFLIVHSLSLAQAWLF
jgi:hypothetical protein